METVPDEIYEMICGKLSSCDLSNAILIDRYSRDIIETSPALMDKLPLYVTDDDEDNEFDECAKLIEPLMNSQRRVTSIVVELKRERVAKYLGVFKKFGESVRSLEIRNYTFDTIDQLRIILRFLPGLQRLKVSNIAIHKPENKILNAIVQIPKLALRQLRHVECVNSDPKIFSLFTNNHDVQLATIRLKVNDAGSFCYADFIQTMSHQMRLEQLRLDGVSTRNCEFFLAEGLVKCQLRQLEVHNCAIVGREQIRNLIGLIKSQRKLRVLKILNTPLPTSLDIMVTYRQIFNNCMSEVHLDIGELSFFHSHSFTNRSVRNLTLYGNFAFENLPIFINFIKMFPSVVQLKLVGEAPIGDKYLFSILSTFRSLEELSLPGFTSRSADSNFSNLSSLDSKLHTLELDYIDYDVKFFGWRNIVTNLRSIEKLVIKRDYGKVSNEIVDIIVKTLKLQHLELGIGVVSADILRTIVYNNCCDQLKVLKIALSDFQKIEDKFDFGKIFSTNRLLLYMCDDYYFQQ